MAYAAIIPPDTIRQLLSYDPETGELTWLERRDQVFGTAHSLKIFNTKFAGRKAFTCVALNGRRQGIILGRPYLAHRVIWALVHGKWPSGEIDHIDGNPLNNRISNLRDVSRATNSKNRKKYSTSTSGVPGVSFHRKTGKWQAGICDGSQKKYVGLFSTKAEACEAVKSAYHEAGFHPNHGRHVATI